MELLVFAHAGAKVLVFPTRGGRFFEYENLRIVDRLRPKIEAGQLQLYCVDSVDSESFYCFWALHVDFFDRQNIINAEKGPSHNSNSFLGRYAAQFQNSRLLGCVDALYPHSGPLPIV